MTAADGTERRGVLGRRAVVRVAVDGHRVTPFELFFDLVFVFAITQITGYVVHEHSGIGVVRGVVLLGLLWWAWSSYAWLGNQAHADRGIVRSGMVVAMVAIFVVALVIPEAWHDAPGGLHAPTVLVVAYLVMRLVHEALYLVAARGDPALRRQLRLNLVPILAGGALLMVGAAVGGDAQTSIWAAALAVDWAITYVTSMRARGWRINSVDHWVERHELVIILALGESVVAIGVGASGAPVDWPLLLGAGLGILVATAQWWLYFDVSADAAAQALQRHDAEARVRAAIEAYTYLHFWMVLGIVITAVGIEEVLGHAADDQALGGFAAGCLLLGPAAYLSGHVGSWIRINGAIKSQRIIAAVVLVALTPVAATVRPLVALALTLAVLVALIGYETARYATVRAELADTRR